MKTLNLTPAIANGDVPDATVLMDRLNRIVTLINTTKLDLDNLNGPSPALVALTNGSAIPTWTAVGGDLTTDASGTFRLHTESGLASTGADLAIIGYASYNNLALSYTVGSAGIYLVRARFNFSISATAGSGKVTMQGRLLKNGTGLLPEQPIFTHYFLAGDNSQIAEQPCTYEWRQTLAIGDVLTLQAQIGSGSTFNYNNPKVLAGSELAVERLS